MSEEEYVCTACGRVNRQPMDVLNRYCGACHLFDKGSEMWVIPHAAEEVFGAQVRGPATLVNVHPRETCRPPCPLHAPSDHHMVGWELNWRGDRGFFERMCPHETGHPDPDSAKFVLTHQGRDVSSHGCDGCCYPPRE